VDELVYNGLASAEAVLTDTERELGTLLVDIGGGTTSIVAFLDGSPIHSVVLPIGGKLITSDLAIGLRSRLEDAEKIKIRLSNEAIISKVDMHSDSEDFDVSEFDLDVESVPRIMLYKIINARLEEIFRLIALEVTRAGLSGKLPAGVVITGGGALTAGVEKSAKVNLKMPVRIGVPKGVTGLIDDIKGPDSAAAVGAVLYGVKLYRGSNLLSFDNKNGSIRKGASKIFDKLKSLLP
ncbi:MAG: cell division protein FtsA, partial [Clostridiaceae bacterium]|nr:cell division protein FtsA [Clostridiaceae bacterium]